MTRKHIVASIFTAILLSIGPVSFTTDVSAQEWRELPCGLWTNGHGDIGLKTTRFRRDGKIETFYLTHAHASSSGGDNIPLKSLVNTETFHYIGASFYKDKNHIYNHFPMSDGGIFYPIDDMVDHATFKVFEDSCYAKDKNSIYVEKHVLIRSDVDYQTFQVIKGCLAQDKHGFIIWDVRATEEDAREYMEVFSGRNMK